MKVVIAIPTHSGDIRSECFLSILSTLRLLFKLDISYEVFVISGCPYLPIARSTLVAMFMKTDGTDLFFIDADVGFDPIGFINILKRPEMVVAGIYPLKQSEIRFPVEVKTKDGIPIGRDGLIEAQLLPTGFMRIKRIVFEEMEKAYPELKYTSNYVHVDNSEITEAYDFFNMGIEDGRKWTTEDYAFCNRWTKIGGQLWVYPDIDFSHIGANQFKGNYHRYLIDLKK